MDETEKRDETVELLVIAALAVLTITSLVAAFAYYCYIRRKVAARRRNTAAKVSKNDCEKIIAAAKIPKNDGEKTSATSGCDSERVEAVVSEKTGLGGVHVFGYKQLHSATGGFGKANIVGNGSFGSVYRGVLPDGRKIAVKPMNRGGKQGEEEFRMEVELLRQLKSSYLMGLIGYCSDGGNRILVYEFMANCGLQEHLYPAGGPWPGSSKLDWDTRMRIALEAAKGLEYLHEHVSPPVIHRDFKSSNILLDDNFHAKVSDFGLAKLGSNKAGGHVSTRVLGTQGYVAPEYALTGHLTTKSDVYSYGVVLLELLTGRIPVDLKKPSGEGILVSWALPMLTDREKVELIMDPAMEGQYSTKDAVQVAAIAAMCVQPEADYRPLMADVVQSLIPLVKNKGAAAGGKAGGGCSSRLPASQAFILDL